MTKRELVIQVANKLGMTQSDVAKIVEGTFEAISESLAQGERWELRDFGVFEVKTRASRIGRNPGKKMKELVSEPNAPAAPGEMPSSMPVSSAPPVDTGVGGD
jgi:nucleoid DNA-binding protein